MLVGSALSHGGAVMPTTTPSFTSQLPPPKSVLMPAQATSLLNSTHFFPFFVYPFLFQAPFLPF